MRDMKRTAQAVSVTEVSQPLKKKNDTLVSVPIEILRDVQFNMIDVKLFQQNILDKSDLILLKSYTNNDEMIEILFELLRNKSEEHHSKFLKVIEEDYNWLRDKCEILLQKMRLDSIQTSINIPSTDNQVIQSQETKNSPEKSSPDSIPLDASKQQIPEISEASSKSSSDSNTACRKATVIDILSVEKLNQTINSDMISVVRRNHRVVRGWTTLAHVLGMTSLVYVLRMRMMMNGEDMDACIIHLLQEWKGRNPQNATLENLLLALREEGYNEVADELEKKFVV